MQPFFKAVALSAFIFGILAFPALAAPPSRADEFKLRVDPADAVLVVEGETVEPHGGVYKFPRSLLNSAHPLAARLRRTGFADLALPPLSPGALKDFEADPLILQPNTLTGYRYRYPWLLPTLCLSLILAAAGIYSLGRREPREEFYEPVHSLADVAEPEPEPEVTAATAAVIAAPEDAMIGRKLGNYKITKRIGSGGMATVYQALPSGATRDSEAVAIKVIRPDHVNAEYEERFEREIKLSMKLNHPNVLRTVDWGQEDNLTYLVMELVDGVALNRLIPAGGLSLEEALKYIAGTMEGLAYAHSLGIVHRDIKPENVMVANNGRVMLMDFGLARSQDVRTLTMMGNAMGTPEYMAPEQIMRGPERKGLTDKSDQYALGILIFEVLTGRRPFEWDADDPVKLIRMHLSDAPPSITSLRPDIPVEVENVLATMLAKDPEHRFCSIKDAGAALYLATQKVVPSSAASSRSLEAIESARAGLKEGPIFSSDTVAVTQPPSGDAPRQ